jgi:NTP pyrophosphatase (non-canonical NTP hydrolase)
MENRSQYYEAIEAELNRAEEKHPDYPQDIFQQLAIMQEEAGEVTKAVLHYHYENGTIEHIHKELVQTAAMCIRMLQNLKTSKP